MSSYNPQLGKAFDLLTEGLKPYVDSKVKKVYRDQWEQQVRLGFKQHRVASGQDHFEWESHTLLAVMWDHWNACFRHDLKNTDRSLISELREYRNQWAHQREFDFDDTYRTIDSIYRLLKSIKADQEILNKLGELKKSLIVEKSSGEIPVYIPPVSTETIPSAQENVREEKLVLKKENHRRNIFLYALCMIAIDAQIYISWGTHGWIMMIIISLVFMMLIIDQIADWRRNKKTLNKQSKDSSNDILEINQTTHLPDQTSVKKESALSSSP